MDLAALAIMVIATGGAVRFAVQKMVMKGIGRDAE